MLEDTGAPIDLQPGFTDLDEMKLILTHPVRGFYHRTDGALGGYSIWHPEMQLTLATAKLLHFSLLERLDLVNKADMSKPHSIFLCPSVEFTIYPPPRAGTDGENPTTFPSNR